LKIQLRILFFLLCTTARAQEGNWSIQLSHATGKLLKHSDKILFKPKSFAQFTELHLSYNTSGNHLWEKIYGLPRYGLGMRYLYLGEPSNILGNGYAFYPFIDFELFERRKSSVRFIIGSGLAFLDKAYHIKYNSSQTAIGSHWNNLTTFQFKLEHAFSSTHLISGGISLSHISNGSFKAPNLGLNYVSAILGYSYHFNSKEKKNNEADSIDLVVHSSNHSVKSVYPVSASAEYGLTLKEAEVPGGPKFLVQWYLLDIAYQYNIYKSFSLAGEIEYNSLDVFKEFSDNGLRLNVYLAHQWMFGSVGLTLRMGYEMIRIKNPDNYPFATKLDLCYIMPFRLVSHIRPYLGFSLKAHLDTAEYIGIMVGLRFNKRELP
jgi:hypothetical protein